MTFTEFVMWKDLRERALWTFIEAAVSYVAVSGATSLTFGLVKGAALAGGAAVLSLIKSLIRERRAFKKFVGV